MNRGWVSRGFTVWVMVQSMIPGPGGWWGPPSGFAKSPEPPREIVFPPPPDPPRIQYLYSLTSIHDLRWSKPGVWAKLWRLLAGGGDAGPALDRPYGVCARDGRVYVADSEGASVVIFDRDQQQVRRLGGTLPGRLVSPIGVAVDDDGQVYVTDSAQGVVKVFGPDGPFRFQFGGEAGLRKPTGIAYDAGRKHLVVADTGNSRILIFDLHGQQVLQMGRKGHGEGEFAVPANLAVDRMGKVYVADTILCRIQVFSPEGQFLATFGEQGDVAGSFARPRGVALDSEGHIYVADALFNAIQIFEPQGKLLLFFGAGGTAPGALDLPAGLFIDSEDRLYVADSLNRRVQVFQYLKVIH